MGISYSSGKLPFVVFVDDKWWSEFDDLYCQHEEAYRLQYNNLKGFSKKTYLFKNGWTIIFDGPSIDDIMTSTTFIKDQFTVYLGCLSDGEDCFIVSHKKKDLQEFVKDFSINEEIEKNFKVNQIG